MCWLHTLLNSLLACLTVGVVAVSQRLEGLQIQTRRFFQREGVSPNSATGVGHKGVIKQTSCALFFVGVRSKSAQSHTVLRLLIHI